MTGSIFKNPGVGLPAPRKERRGGPGGKHCHEANFANPTFDGPPGFGPPNKRDYPGGGGPSGASLLKGMNPRRKL